MRRFGVRGGRHVRPLFYCGASPAVGSGSSSEQLKKNERMQRQLFRAAVFMREPVPSLGGATEAVVSGMASLACCGAGSIGAFGSVSYTHLTLPTTPYV